MIHVIGILALLCLTFATVPQLVKSFKERHCDGISWGYLGLLEAGFILMFLYVALAIPNVMVLINYGINITLFGILIWIKSGRLKK